MITSSVELADRLGSIIQAVPGVRMLYPAAPILTTVGSEVVAAATATRPTATPIVVEQRAAQLAATIHIGVNGVSPAPQVAHAAGAAAIEFLRSTGADDAVVTVRIGSVG
ncbi:hypothetical protein [Salinibacterium sp.]|uniref:hypothetical protein n=1 Tax=Salinibacterium sp. TaxID=1915057 RepID=UPI00286D097B|nr:hypothetical protein [Salinibacterium sp.]